MAIWEQIFTGLDNSFLWLFVPLVFTYTFLGLDDLVVDLYYWIGRTFFGKPKIELLDSKTLNQLQKLPQKKIAIMVAAWKEDKVIGHMINGNNYGIDYNLFDFFIGVYPNDEKTKSIALDLQEKYPNVHVHVNTLNGPTCKGQMINQIVQSIFHWEKVNKKKFELYMFHDCEDIIHTKALRLINFYSDQYDFIQIPVFSLPVTPFSFVAGTYMDEFTESHLKDLLVRNDLNCAIPSAGVGTAMSRRFVTTYCENQNNELFNLRTLTEDYELGISTPKYEFKSKIASCYYILKNGKKEFIATREYFPKLFWKSVKQKTRWTLGIIFQGTKNIGWTHRLKENFFLFRDRKGIISAPLSLISMLFFIYLFARNFWNENLLKNSPQILYPFIILNILYMLNRFAQRFYFTHFVYGTEFALLIPFRIVVGNIINALAINNAVIQFVRSELTGVEPQWNKTEHEVPVGFGAMGAIDNSVTSDRSSWSIAQQKAILSILFLFSFSLSFFHENETFANDIKTNIVKTNLFFSEHCQGTNQATPILEETGGFIQFKIEGLDSNQKLEFELTIAPLYKKSDNSDSLIKINRKNVRIPKNGIFEFKKPISFSKKLLEKNPHYWVYHADVIWRQLNSSSNSSSNSRSNSNSNSSLSDIATARVFVNIFPDQNFFIPQSTILCQWEGPPSIDSQYYYNSSLGLMFIERSIDISNASATELTFGQDPDQNNPSRFIFLPVYFSQSLTYKKETSDFTSFTQIWKLEPGQGGFLGRRFIFNRYKAMTYVKKKQNNCSVWKKETEGYLDVGSSNTSFYAVPSSLSALPDESTEFMKKIRPAIDTCKTPIFNGSLEYFIDGSQGSMYFYPIQLNNRSQNE